MVPLQSQVERKQIDLLYIVHLRSRLLVRMGRAVL
jgi:hypothetical protein